MPPPLHSARNCRWRSVLQVAGVYLSEDWVKYMLDLPMVDSPGTQSRYCSGNVLVAASRVGDMRAF